MEGGVAFIFKTLIKVPCIIFVSFFLFNIVAFFLIYFKLLGISYVLMQEVVSNNEISKSQANQIAETYLKPLNKTELCKKPAIIVSKNKTGTGRSDFMYYGYKGKSDTSADFFYETEPDSPDIAYNASNAYTNAIGEESGHNAQYGDKVCVGISMKYTLVWPLDYQETDAGKKLKNTKQVKNVKGYKHTGTLGKSLNITTVGGGTYADGSDNDTKSNDHRLTVEIPLRIYYIVPGLKYYADRTYN